MEKKAKSVCFGGNVALDGELGVGFSYPRSPYQRGVRAAAAGKSALDHLFPLSIMRWTVPWERPTIDMIADIGVPDARRDKTRSFCSGVYDLGLAIPV